MQYSSSVIKTIVDDNVSMYVIKVRQDEDGEEAESSDHAALLALGAILTPNKDTKGPKKGN